MAAVAELLFVLPGGFLADGVILVLVGSEDVVGPVLVLGISVAVGLSE